MTGIRYLTVIAGVIAVSAALAVVQLSIVHADTASTVLVPVDDITVSELSPGQSFDPRGTLSVGTQPHERVLLRFEVSDLPAGARVESARLALHELTPGDARVAVHLAAPSWNSGTTWSTAPAIGEWVAELSRTLEDPTVIEADVTAAIRGSATVEFYLVSVAGDRAIYGSSESPASPTLTIEWQDASDSSVVHDTHVEPDLDPVPGADLDPDDVAQDPPSGDVGEPEFATVDPELVAAAATAATSSTLKAAADASLYAEAPNTNRGNNTRLDVDGSPRVRSLLRFDLSTIPQGSIIRSARLRVLVTDGSAEAGAVYRVSGSWSEGSVTWNNAPGVGSRVATIGSVTSGTWKVVDVTAVATAGAPLNLYLISSYSNGAQYTSSESSNAPQLLVEWESGSAYPSPAPSTGCTAVPSSRLELLKERAGFGKGVTGAASGCLYIVTNANDDGPGSLRWAAERGGYWIVFGGDFTIRLSDQIEVAGNTTIDGRGRHVALERGGLYIRHADSSNVILTDLTLRNSPSGEDLIQVRDGATGFWLHHLTLLDSSDEFIDIGNAPSSGTRGTISWTRFDRTDGYEMVFIMGDNNGIQNNDEIRVTAHHNYYAGTNSRHPLITGAKLHSYNNVYRWLRWGIQVREGDEPSEVVSEGDIFDARGSLQPKQGIYFQGGVNHVRVTGALFLNGAGIQNPSLYGSPSRAFSPSGYYGYTVETANSSLFDRVTAGAGVR